MGRTLFFHHFFPHYIITIFYILSSLKAWWKLIELPNKPLAFGLCLESFHLCFSFIHRCGLDAGKVRPPLLQTDEAQAAACWQALVNLNIQIF
jgi:hypothetical protein